MRTSRTFRVRRVLCFAVCCLLLACSTPSAHPPVRLDLYVMSQCQFGWELLNELLPTADALGDEVELHLGYVGDTERGALTAVRGLGELLGDKLQLCARDVGGESKWRRFLS